MSKASNYIEIQNLEMIICEDNLNLFNNISQNKVSLLSVHKHQI